jgi:hypothetical protein
MVVERLFVEVFLWPMNLGSAPLIDTSAPPQHYFTEVLLGETILTGLAGLYPLEGHPLCAAMRFVQFDAGGTVTNRWSIRSTILCHGNDVDDVLAFYPGEQPIGTQHVSAIQIAVIGGPIPPVIFYEDLDDPPFGPGTGGSTVQPPDLPPPDSGDPPKPPVPPGG